MKQKFVLALPELRNRVNREVGLGSHSLSHSSPVLKKIYNRCGRKVPWKKKEACLDSELLSTLPRWFALFQRGAEKIQVMT